MANLIYIQENQLVNAPSNNLLSKFMMFNDAFTWNVVSGTATASNVNGGVELEGVRCLRIVPNYSVGATVNSGGGETKCIIPQDGRYVFSIKHKSEFTNMGANMAVGIIVYVNSEPTTYYFDAIYSNNGVYRTYYQVLTDLVQGDELEFAFIFDTTDIGGTYKNYFDAFKLEFDNYGLGLPTVFSEPINSIYETTQSISFGSIASNDTHEQTITLVGAVEYDYVELTAEYGVFSSDVTFTAFVTADDTVTVYAHNKSGSSVSISGNFKVKIVK